jgi:hypothetical protein
MKFKVTLLQETYTDILIEADDSHMASEKVLMGEFDEDDITDVTVKDSEIIGAYPANVHD